MDIQSVKVNPVKIEQGAWLGEKYGKPIPEMGDLCLHVRGVNNADWKRLQSSLFAALPRNKRVGGRIEPQDQDEITTKCLVETGLIGWDNLKNGDEQIAFTKEASAELLNNPELRALRDAVLWACTMVGEVDAETTKEIAGN